jgi:hypothetical protein
VHNGFAEAVSAEELEGNVRVDPEMLEENLMFRITRAGHCKTAPL